MNMQEVYKKGGLHHQETLRVNEDGRAERLYSFPTYPIVKSLVSGLKAGDFVWGVHVYALKYLPSDILGEIGEVPEKEGFIVLYRLSSAEVAAHLKECESFQETSGGAWNTPTRRMRAWGDK